MGPQGGYGTCMTLSCMKCAYLILKGHIVSTRAGSAWERGRRVLQQEWHSSEASTIGLSESSDAVPGTFTPDFGATQIDAVPPLEAINSLEPTSSSEGSAAAAQSAASHEPGLADKSLASLLDSGPDAANPDGKERSQSPSSRSLDSTSHSSSSLSYSAPDTSPTSTTDPVPQGSPPRAGKAPAHPSPRPAASQTASTQSSQPPRSSSATAVSY